MSSADLINEIRQFVARVPSIRELPVAESEAVCAQVGRRFISDVKTHWWWTSLRGNSWTIRYGDEDGIDVLRDLLSDNETAFLAVTDDEQGPWPVLEGRVDEFIELLHNQRFFEYFIVDSECDWIVFDTHENALIVGGTLAERAAKLSARRDIGS